ncbi:uncharacterized protein [Montipora capricornis]|uniref:uncharacterized protein isoform X1 n=1 Tax=Montipora capricornis TaxID=246305 RepID=UPI0035F1FD5C
MKSSVRKRGSFIVLTILLFLKVSTIMCASLQCKKNCTNGFVTIYYGPDKCNDCWQCTECQEGLGSSVACGTNVTYGTSIHCVECVSGVNFSDSNGIEQCQPCGLCDGKHERLVAECTPEMNVICECQDGYYRNETNGQCLPCASCCSTEFKGDIQQRCSDDGGKITRKCKFNSQKQTICESLRTTTPDPSLLVSSSEPSKTILTEIIPISVTSSERQGVLNASASKSPDQTNPTPNNTQDWLWVTAAIIVVVYIVITISYLFVSQKWKQTTSCSRSESSTSRSCRHPLLGVDDLPDHRITSQPCQQNRKHMQAPKGDGDDPEVCLDPVAESARFFPTYPDGLQTQVDQSCVSNAACTSNALEVTNTGAQVPKSCTHGLTNIHLMWPCRNSLDQAPKGAKWSALSQTDKYNTKMLEVPFLLLHKIYLSLDIKRSDGNDIRQFADKLDISVKEFDGLEQMAKVKQVTTSEVILKEVFVEKHPPGTVGDFIRIMKDMRRDDIISLINS